MEQELLKALSYPFDPKLIMRKKRAIRKALVSREGLMDKKIAVLGGSTTAEIKEILELFLLYHGIRPEFYESEYNKFYEDGVFGNPELDSFSPDIVYIHTGNRNIQNYPELTDSPELIEEKAEAEYGRFEKLWASLRERFSCPIIQNNFEYPSFRILGNRDGVDKRGRLNYINRLNDRFYSYSRENRDFYINDINYLSADYGLERWSDSFFWHMYKYSLPTEAIPSLAHNLANIIKSIYGKNKKALALDLDNTLWGGIVGDDGAENLEIGQETPIGQCYSEFQTYLKELSKTGVILNIISKNEEKAAISGLEHPDMILKKDDFISIKASWEPKSRNLIEMASETGLLPESYVFVDDNPAEREIVRQEIPGCGVPELTKAEYYIKAIDKAGYFEVTSLSEEDLKRGRMYGENAKRENFKRDFGDYREYLKSLDMKAVIRPFDDIHLSRIAQLTNKSNQFNLTTLRLSRDELEAIVKDDGYITLYGSLTDRFGDNGVVSLAIGKQNGIEMEIILWLMSCRVLKRDMEMAMMDEFKRLCYERKEIILIRGHYYPTEKNKMVEDFYADMGFLKVSQDEDGSSDWIFDISLGFTKENDVIEVNADS